MKSELELRKDMSRLTRESRAEAKRETCYICNKPVSSFCNSHSIPQYILRAIAEDSELLQSSALAGIPLADEIKGVNNTGIFHLICNDCDSRFFSEYESPKCIRMAPTTKLLAQIALKNYLMQISKRLYEKALYKNLQSLRQQIKNKEALDAIHDADLRDYEFAYRRTMKILDNDLKSGFRVVHWELLPYVVPIAVQTPIVLYKNIDGSVVFDIYDMSEKLIMHELHLCVFPLAESSVIILFFHRDDREYISFERQFLRLSHEKKLEYINYLIFRYTESFCVSKNLRKLLIENEKIRELCRDTGAPNLGMLTTFDLLIPYEPVKPNEIPNLLNEEFRLPR